MPNGVYYILIIAVGVAGMFFGYRRGFLRQIGGVLGMTFGIVAGRMFSGDIIPYIDDFIPSYVLGFRRDFVIQTVTCGLIYLVVSYFIQLCCFPLGKIMSFIGGGMADQIVGAAFKMFKYLFILSIFYNVIVDWNPKGSLSKSSRLHDGNLVEGVIKIAPPILGFPDGEEVSKRQQLEDARSIS